MLLPPLATVGSLLALTWAAFAAPTTIQQIDVRELLARSEFVFEGVVTAKESVGVGGLIVTRVTFDVVDVLKGDSTTREISLEFAGGESRGHVLVIGGIRTPFNMERGVYFVESLSRRQVHPLYGWDQGRFLVLAGNVYTATGLPVFGVEPGEAEPGIAVDADEGVAVGIRTSARSDGNESRLPLSVAAFKNELLAIGW